MDHHDERLELKSRTQLTAQAAMIKRGTAAQGVPVRQKRVAELDDDVAVLSSGKLEETKRDWRFRCKSGTKITRARTQLCVATRRNLAREKLLEPAKSEKHTFSRVTVAKPAMPKKSRELESTSREPDFGSQRIRFFHGNENKVISTLL
jgi:hypothetical protein